MKSKTKEIKEEHQMVELNSDVPVCAYCGKKLTKGFLKHDNSNDLYCDLSCKNPSR